MSNVEGRSSSKAKVKLVRRSRASGTADLESDSEVARLKRELRRSSNELRHARDQAEAANTAKTAFLANMSHEIRTPLGVVLGFSELLVSTEMTTEERWETIEVIKRNGELLSNVINDILDLSKVEAGRLAIERVPTELREVFQDLNHLLAIEAAEKGLKLSICPRGSLPRMITTDPLRLRQILQNIVGNAIKFTSVGEIRVWVDFDQDHGDCLSFTIEDSGSGISSDQIPVLFSPFAQGDGSMTRKFGGAGIGLALARKLAQRLGGDTVLLSSELGRGSRFRISIDPGPRAGLELVAASALNLRSAQSAGQSADIVTNGLSGDSCSSADHQRPMSNLFGARVLLVEDSPDNQALIGQILRKAEVDVAFANNGREGLEKALANQFDLVLMDLQMPEMDGYRALAELRARGYQQPVIALTAHAMREDRQRCLASGFDEHLSKPIDRPHLLATLRSFVSEGPAQS